MSTSAGLRERYGDVFVSRLTGLDVPWRLLSIKDFLKYQADLVAGIVSKHVIEEEIFRRCVVDPEIASDLKLPAGVVPLVAQQILSTSGPLAPEQFNQELTIARTITQSNPLYEAGVLICRAFPAYTPEQVFSLTYPDFMLRLAQAESLLLKAGVLTEPIEMIPPNQVEAKEAQKAKQRGKKPVPRGVKEAWERAQKAREENSSQKPTPTVLDRQKPSTAVPGPIKEQSGKSPVIEAAEKGKFYLKEQATEIGKESRMLTTEAGGWDRAEMPNLRAKMIEDAREIYKDLLGSLNTAPTVKKHPA